MQQFHQVVDAQSHRFLPDRALVVHLRDDGKAYMTDETNKTNPKMDKHTILIVDFVAPALLLLQDRGLLVGRTIW